jgi:micrococcal nuclease
MERPESLREGHDQPRSPLGLTILLVVGLVALGKWSANHPQTPAVHPEPPAPEAVAAAPVDRRLPMLTRNSATHAGRHSGTVTRIIDGDTFIASFSDRPVRIWGLDAPERNQAGGAAATAELTRMAAGRLVVCEIRDIDRYNRLVGQCILPGGVDITAAMIRAGVAREYCHFSRNYYGTC